MKILIDAQYNIGDTVTYEDEKGNEITMRIFAIGWHYTSKGKNEFSYLGKTKDGENKHLTIRTQTMAASDAPRKWWEFWK